MRIERLMLAVAVAAAFSAGASSVSQAQTTSTGSTTTTTSATGASSTGTTPTTSTSSTSSTTSSTSGTSGTTTATSGISGTSSTAPSPNASSSETQYLRHVPARYVTLAGSSSNLQSLVHGLRTGSAVTLTSTQASGTTPATQSITFTPPTRPMGYGNITRALTLASRELAAAGIRNPTPQQLQSALTGGTVTTAQGTVTMPGVLQLRSQGMGWGQIAHTIGVHPGQGASRHEIAEHSVHQRGITTATGAKESHATTSGAKHEAAEHSTSAHRGIVTASGSGTTTVQRAHSVETHARTGIVTASGASTTNGIVSAAGNGSTVARGHEGKH